MTDVNGAGGQGAAAKRPTIDSPSSQVREKVYPISELTGIKWTSKIESRR